MTPLVCRKNAISPRLLCCATVILAFHHCTGSQQSASRGCVLAFYRITLCLKCSYKISLVFKRNQLGIQKTQMPPLGADASVAHS